MPLSAADAAKQKQDAERQAVERLKAAMTGKLNEMREASPSQAEGIHNALKAQCKDTRLSPEFKNFVLKRARHFECDSNMRAATKAMNEAVDYALSEKLAERGARLAMGRQWFSKACSLGANDEFRRATERLIETAMMTGGVYKPGVATRAKPVDTAPKNPNDPKAMPPEDPKAVSADKEAPKDAKPEGDKAAESAPSVKPGKTTSADGPAWISQRH
jgi:hypothetical protein